MLKKIMALIVCALLTTVAFPAQAAGWGFASACSSGPPQCPPPASSVVFFYGGSTYAACLSTLTAYEGSFWNVYPWTLSSDCFPQ